MIQILAFVENIKDPLHRRKELKDPQQREWIPRMFVIIDTIICSKIQIEKIYGFKEKEMQKYIIYIYIYIFYRFGRKKNLIYKTHQKIRKYI